MAQNKSKFNGRIRLLVIIGCSLLVLLVCAIASLFILEIEDVIYADGQVTSEFTIDMVSHLDGRITKLYVNAGQDVKKGDIIAEIDSTRYEQEYMEIKSALQELEAEKAVKLAELAVLERNPLPKDLWYAETTLNECKDRLERTKRRLERLEGLKQKQAVSQHEYESVEIEYIRAVADAERAAENFEKVKSGLAGKMLEKARKDVEQVQSRINSRKNALAFAQRYIDDCKIIAPANGRIIELPCKYSLYLEKGKLLGQLAVGDNLKGIAYVSEAQIRKVKPGQKVRISSEVFSRLEYGIFTGKVEVVYDTPVSSNKSAIARYPVRIRLDSPGLEIKYGSSAKFAIVAGYEPVLYSLFGFTKNK